MNIVNVGYDSTNYYIVEAKSGKLLVDCGWPGTLPKFTAELKRKGISIKEIKHLLVTHFHPDHAGLAQELKNQGLKLIVLEPQTDFIPPFADFFKGKNLPYVPITQNDNLLLKLEDSRKFLAGIGLDGEILYTPGHSDDSVTLILDEGYAFTGDLHPSFMNTDDAITRASWDKIYQHKIKRIFPGHGGSAISSL
ncbi:MAG TPA: MBL fold metallo-hydrolase [Anaerolineales bacterium]|jgi:glyoxylase-like metal-dependent hydrolase (beta-lactamase superfamily II)|nr:MBL fold metallo-hydrolase [Anaerolineales bacterium]